MIVEIPDNSYINVAAIDWLNLQNRLAQANARAEQLTTEKQQAQQQAANANEQVQKLAQELTEARAEIDRLIALQKPVPPVVVPEQKPLPPVIPAPFSLKGTVMGCIVADDAPSDAQDEIILRSINEAKNAGCNSVSFFMDEENVKRLLVPDRFIYPERNPVFYADRFGLWSAADAVESAIRQIDTNSKTTEERLNRTEAFFAGLVKLGFKLAIINDFDGVLNGVPRFTDTERLQLVNRIKNTRTLPVMASCTGRVDPDDFKRRYGLDYVEVQTFDTMTALKGFVAQPYDMFCLDMRASTSIDRLRGQRAIVAGAQNVTAARLYAIRDRKGAFWNMTPEWRAEVGVTVNVLKERWSG